MLGQSKQVPAPPANLCDGRVQVARGQGQHAAGPQGCRGAGQHAGWIAQVFDYIPERYAVVGFSGEAGCLNSAALNAQIPSARHVGGVLADFQAFNLPAELHSLIEKHSGAAADVEQTPGRPRDVRPVPTRPHTIDALQPVACGSTQARLEGGIIVVALTTFGRLEVSLSVQLGGLEIGPFPPAEATFRAAQQRMLVRQAQAAPRLGTAGNTRFGRRKAGHGLAACVAPRMW